MDHCIKRSHSGFTSGRLAESKYSADTDSDSLLAIECATARVSSGGGTALLYVQKPLDAISAVPTEESRADHISEAG